ncbi:MAG: hypothetical protein HRU41_16860 [Saprospiraceae bacterium]|nr:hypothetical protein [Saprospiraceae bacterium]
METLDQLSDSTRVWIYQSNQPFKAEDETQVKTYIKQFAQQWVSHNRQLKAFGDLLHRQFVVLMVDESQAGASGCSIDSSVRFMKGLQTEFGVDLFDRMTFTYLEGKQVKTADRATFAARYKAGEINDETLVFDTLVDNKSKFENSWVKPLGQSWHKRMV